MNDSRFAKDLHNIFIDKCYGNEIFLDVDRGFFWNRGDDLYFKTLKGCRKALDLATRSPRDEPEIEDAKRGKKAMEEYVALAYPGKTMEEYRAMMVQAKARFK
jgi:hypothetical protein